MSEDRSKPTCARPGCAAGAGVTLVFRYASREVLLRALDLARGPHAYDLCGVHARRTRPPRGWTLLDERHDESSEAVSSSRPASGADPPPVAVGSPHTVAVLAGVLGRASADVPQGRPRHEQASVPLSADDAPLPAELSEDLPDRREPGPSPARTW